MADGGDRKRVRTEAPAPQMDLGLNTTMLKSQNERLMGKVNEQKQEIGEMEKKIESLQLSQQSYSSDLSAVNRAWTQLTSDLSNIGERLGVDVPKENGADSDGETSFLARLLRAAVPDKIEDSVLNDKLEERVKETKGVMEKVVAALLDQRKRTEAVLAKAEEGPLKDEVKALKESLAKVEKSSETLQLKEKEASAKTQRLSDEIAALKLKQKDVSRDLDDALEDKDTFRRKADRLKKQVDELTGQLNESKKKIENLELNMPADGGKAGAGGGASSEGAAAGVGGGVANEEMAAELEEAKSLASTRGALIDKLRAEIDDLRKDTLKLEHDKMSPTSLQQVPAFAALKQNLATALANLEDKATEVRDLHAQLAEAHNIRHQETMMFESNAVQKEEMMQVTLQQLRDAQQSTRTQLEQTQFALEKLKNSPPEDERVKEMKALLTNQGTHITRLKAEIQRMKQSQDGSEKSAALQATLGDIHEKMSEMYKRLEETEKNQKLLEAKSRELDSMRKSIEGMDQEKRPIAEVRVSEARLIEENKRLVEKLNSPEGEIFRKLDMEKQELAKRLSRADKAVTSLTRQLKELKETEDGLMQEIETIGSVFEENQEQNARLLQQLSEKDELSRQMMSEKLKLTQTEVQLRQERDAFQEKSRTASELATVQTDMIRKLEAAVKTRDEVVAKSNEEIRLANMISETHKQTARQSEQAVEERERKLRQALDDSSEVKKRVDKEMESLRGDRNRLQKVEEEYASLKRKFNKISSKGGNDDSYLQDELDEYRKMVLCTVCNVRPKNATLTKCMHVFCETCLRKAVEVRNRKCPSCKKGFSESDISLIYLS